MMGLASVDFVGLHANLPRPSPEDLELVRSSIRALREPGRLGVLQMFV